MERSFTAPTEADPDDLYRVVADLATYPDWLELVSEVTPLPSAEDEGSAEPVWAVTLRARLGPLARSKRLRMVRTEADGRRVRFERQEIDGRDHADWVLSAEVRPRADGPWRSEVSVDLRYGGGLWTGLLDGVLDAAAEHATRNLQRHVTAAT